MKNKIIKKIIGLFGYKLVEKDYIKNMRAQSSNSALNIKNLLKNYCDQNKLKSLLQIGANDGKRFDELNYFIKKYKIKSVLVEPINKYFNELKNNYLNHEFVKIENSAISVENEISYLFVVNEKYINKYDEHIKGINSFEIKHLIKHGVKKNHIEKKKINSLSISNLIKKYNIEELDLLYVDTEGYDGKIVYEFIKDTQLKPIIIFEYIHIENKFFNKLIDLLNTEKFKFFAINENLICYPPKRNFLI